MPYGLEGCGSHLDNLEAARRIFWNTHRQCYNISQSLISRTCVSWLNANSWTERHPSAAWIKLVYKVSAIFVLLQHLLLPIHFHVCGLDLIVHRKPVLRWSYLTQNLMQNIPDGESVLVLIQTVENTLLIDPEVHILKLSTLRDGGHLQGPEHAHILPRLETDLPVQRGLRFLSSPGRSSCCQMQHSNEPSSTLYLSWQRTLHKSIDLQAVCTKCAWVPVGFK